MTELALYDQTMTSREIASATGKRHDHVLRDTRAMLDELELHSTQIWGEYKDSTGRTLPEAHLDRDLTLTLVSGYSAKLRYAVVRRMRALEAIVLEQQLTEHGRVVGDRMLFDHSTRWFRRERELEAEIEELKQQNATL